MRESSLEEPPAQSRVRLSAPLTLYRGGVLDEVEIAYETWGRLAKNNLLLLFTGLSPSAHAASSQADPTPGWWEEMIGPGRAIDTNRWFVVCVNSLGSCFGSTGPASINPATGERWRLDFPLLAVEDIARGARATLEALGLPAPTAVIGSSLGGMSALAFALQFPRDAPNLLLISTAVHARPFAIAIRSMQREAIRRDPDWKDGNYAPRHEPETGMRLARKIGMLSYRSPDEWRERFGRARIRPEAPGPAADFRIAFEIESYLEAHAERFVGGFDANCYLYLSQAMDHFDAAEHGDGDLARAFSRLETKRALVIGVESDILFPLAQQQELASLLENSGA
ncbi:MAG TPA: homoserine O-acetyltransferase, partial [Gammaproteobacteria bacterium]|nr:homoserine O-acetyltransferase [Gammaproteobacteria bacterium]